MTTIVNYFNENDFIIKHELSTLDDETSIYSKQNFRAMPDKSTSAYVEIFLKNDEQRYNFINYTYHKLNSDIQTKINHLLIKNKQKPLFNNEKILFHFKGGNIMAEYTRDLFANLTTEIKQIKLNETKNNNNAIISDFILDKNGDQKYTFGDLFEILKQQFSISDIDYSVIILTDNYIRYKIIYKYVAQIIVTSLDEIAQYFDDLLASRVNLIQNDGQDENYDDDSFENYNHFRTFLQILSNKPDEICQKYKNEVIINMTNMINLPLNYCLLTYNIIYNIFELFEYIYDNQFNNYKIVYYTKLQNILNYKKNKIIQSNFYTLQKINDYKTRLANDLPELLNKVLYQANYSGTTITVKTVELIRPPVTDDISLKTRNNLNIRYTNNPLEITQMTNLLPQRHHYITTNNLINRIRLNRSLNTHFDLFRIKFNTVLSNCVSVTSNDNTNTNTVSIPSEFIDVSIPIYGCDSLKDSHIEDHIAICNFQIDNLRLQIYSYTLEEVISDLLYVLFEQNFCCPWIDKKYIKRINRVVVLLWLYYYSQNEVETFENILKFNNALLKYYVNTTPFPYDIVKEFVEYDLDIKKILDSMTDLKLTDNMVDLYKHIIVNPKYKLISQYIRSGILLSLLQKKSNTEYFDFISLLREKYAFAQYNAEDEDKVVNDYKKNSLEMLQNINNVGYYLLYFGKIKSTNLTGGNTKCLSNYSKYKQKYFHYKKQAGGRMANQNVITMNNIEQPLLHEQNLTKINVPMTDIINQKYGTMTNTNTNFVLSAKLMNELNPSPPKITKFASKNVNITFTQIKTPYIKQNSTPIVPFTDIVNLDTY